MAVSGLDAQLSQPEFGRLVGISQPAVSGLIKRGVLDSDGTAQQWLHAYCSHIREQAAGRSGGALNLVEERAGLAREQRLLTELKRRKEEKEVAPIDMIIVALSRVSSQLSAVLDAVPGKIKRACRDLPASALVVVEEELAKARNIAAEITVELGDDDDDDEGDSAGDQQGDLDRAQAA